MHGPGPRRAFSRAGAACYIPRPMEADIITLPRPDDWHVHLRDGALLQDVLAATAAAFARAIVMPNLQPPVRSSAAAARYRDKIRAALPAGSTFEPLMTGYLTDTSDPTDIRAGAAAGVLTAMKLYPAGATTNSAAGVTRIAALDAVFETMAAIDLPLLIHGEVVDPAVDVFDREAVFIEQVLEPLRRRHPGLRMVLEHITTADAVDYVLDADPAMLGATITPHHLAVNRNAMFTGGICPHYYCLPIIKRERHREALCRAACSGDAHFFLGTDSAPHPRTAKETACGCAGIYNAPTALPTYLELFHAAGRLDNFAAFASHNGPRFYRLPPNSTKVTWRRVEPLPEPAATAGADEPVVFIPPGGVRWLEEPAA